MVDKTITQRVVERARSAYGVQVYTHSQWGSRARGVYATRRRTRPVARLKADTLVQHITVTLDTGPLSGDFFRDCQTVERIGLERFGSGVSYNWLVDMKTGSVAAGQPLDAKGTHTINDKNVAGYSYDQNQVARAIAVIGMENTPLSDEAAHAISGIIAAMMDEEALTENPDYKPHSFFAWKDCPCDSTRNHMGAILDGAKNLRQRKPRTQTETRVAKARTMLEESLLLLRKVPAKRRRVHEERKAIAEALARMPKA